MNATENNARSMMVVVEPDLSAKGGAKANDSIVVSNQVINKPSELGANST